MAYLSTRPSSAWATFVFALSLAGLACDDVRLGADKGLPSITIESPERGDTLLVQEGHRVAVSGRVEPGVGKRVGLILQANGRGEDPIPVAQDGSFEAVLLARPGLNSIILEAVNSASRRSRVGRAFHYAPAYAQVDSSTADTAQPAMLSASISDWALDWGSPEDRIPYDPCSHQTDGSYACTEVRDLASLFELGLNNVDFSALQPEVPTTLDLIERTWVIDLLGFAEVRVRLSGTIDLLFQISRVEVGEAKVLELQSRDGGIVSSARFRPYTDPSGVTHPGLDADISLQATLFIGAWVDIASDDPGTQNTLCNLADGLCNIFPPHDCLDEYLASCSSNPTPVAAVTSGLDAPVLGGLSTDEMRLYLSLDVGLDEQSKQAQVSLADLAIDLELGSLDLSAFEDVTIQLGTVEIAGFDIDLGDYTLPHTFLGDVIDFLTDLLLNAIAPLIEPLLGQMFNCSDPQNPMCLLIPFMEQMIEAYQTERNLTLPDPLTGTMSQTQISLQTKLERVSFTDFYGGQISLSGRANSHRSAQLADHVDDDLLGSALLAGCLVADPGFEPPPTGQRTMQLAPALDLLNMILAAAWNNGAFDLELNDGRYPPADEWQITNFQARLKPWLPPLFNQCLAEPDDLVLQWGDVELSMDFHHLGRDWSLHAFCSMSVPVKMTLDSQDQFSLEDRDGLPVWQLETVQLLVDGQPGREVDRDRISALLLEWLPGLLHLAGDQALGQLDVLKPKFQISHFPGVDGTTSHLGMAELQAHINQGRIVINGDLLP